MKFLRMWAWLLTLNFLALNAFGLQDAALRCDEPYPKVESIKGLQIQMVDDALELGIRHAALNIDLAQVIAPEEQSSGQTTWEYQGQRFGLNEVYLQQLDRQIKPLSDRGVIVTAILLNYVPESQARREIAMHPRYDFKCPNRLSAFNIKTEVGRLWLKATIAHLAWRWSRPDSKNGRVWNWIVGNEVNSHWYWFNSGRVEMAEFADEYLEMLQLVLRGVRQFSLHGRVYVSLEHHWNIRYAGGDDSQTFPAKPFLEYLSAKSNEQGGIDWHVAFHPYPENLFEPRFWLDQSATSDWDTTPRITFKNLGVLPAFLQQPVMRHQGQTRRIILSEQGFHTPQGDQGELLQAAAFCYAWKIANETSGVDAFILHRHVDHAAEGGLQLGLWTRKAGSVCEPQHKKKSYFAFQAADTTHWESDFEFALPIVGLKSWADASSR